MNAVEERYRKFREEIEPEIAKKREPENTLTAGRGGEKQFDRLDDAYWQAVEKNRMNYHRRARAQRTGK